MKRKSLYWLISTLSIFAFCCIVVMYVQYERDRKSQLDYSVSLDAQKQAVVKTQIKAVESVSAPKNVEKTLVDNSETSDKQIKEAKKVIASGSKVADSIKNDANITLNSMKKSNGSELVESESVVIDESNNLLVVDNADDKKTLNALQVFELNSENEGNNATSDGELVNVSENSNQSGITGIIGGNSNLMNNLPGYTVSSQITSVTGTVLNETQNQSTGSLIAMTDIPADQAYIINTKPMKATGIGGVEDPFATGGAADNPIPYNDNNVLGSMPVPDGSLFLFVLSFLFFAYKFFKKAVLNQSVN